MKRFVKALSLILLAAAIILGTAWYLLEYDTDFTHDLLLEGARFFEKKDQHAISTWLYDAAYKYGTSIEEISLELAEEQAEEQRKLQLRRRSLTSAMLAGIAALEVILNVVNFGIRFPYTSASNYPRGTEAAASIIRYMKERENEPFYRAEVWDVTLNSRIAVGNPIWNEK